MKDSKKSQRQTLLLVDDNQDLRYAVKECLLLLDENLNFMDACNGKEALKKCREKKPDLVLLDIMMPVMDGWETAAKIKEDPLLKDIPIIFMTVKRDEISKLMGKLSVSDYIEKPFERESLYKKIKKALKK